MLYYQVACFGKFFLLWQHRNSHYPELQPKCNPSSSLIGFSTIAVGKGVCCFICFVRFKPDRRPLKVGKGVCCFIRD